MFPSILISGSTSRQHPRQEFPRLACRLSRTFSSAGFCIWASTQLPLAAAPADPAALNSGSHAALARALNQAFIEVTEQTAPSVVVINVVQSLESQSSGGLGDSWFENLPPQLRRYFEENLDPDAPNPPGEKGREPNPPPGNPKDPPSPRPRQLPRPPGEYDGRGSGIVIREDGFILTNSHVVENAERISVRFQDGREFKATIGGRDEKSDLAVLKIEARGLRAAVLGDSDSTKVGEFVVAMGAPFELDYSVTFGHISAKGRSGLIPAYAGGGSMDQDFIQTDASINPGNSGGPLVNLSGEVIGINTLIRGLNRGIGFAIPSNLARGIADSLITHGYLKRAYLGVGIRDLRDYPDFRDLTPEIKEGVVVESIQPGSPAAKSELEPADIILAVNETPVATTQQLRDAIRNKAGQEIGLKVARAGDRKQISITPDPWPETESRPPRRSAPAPAPAPLVHGMKIQALKTEPSQPAASGTKPVQGVRISEVEPNSLAARRGLRAGDLITAVNYKPIGNPEEFQNAIAAAENGKGWLISFSRGGIARFEILRNPPAE